MRAFFFAILSASLALGAPLGEVMAPRRVGGPFITPLPFKTNVAGPFVTPLPWKNNNKRAETAEAEDVDPAPGFYLYYPGGPDKRAEGDAAKRDV